MQPHLTHRLGDQGMILFSSLAILSVLLMVGVGARVMLQNDYRVLTNLRGGTNAFYLATAGLEWSKNEIARATTFPPAPADRSEGFASGAFAVTFLSPELSGPLSAKILVRSTGSVGSSANTVEAQLRKTYDLADGALGLRGNGSQVVLNGGAILVSGLDHDPVSGSIVTTAKPRAAVTAGDDSLLGLVNVAASGLPAGSLESGASNPASATSEYLPAAALSQLVSSLCGQATANVSTVPVTGALVYENQTWGTRATPELRCIDGLSEPGDGVTLAGDINGSGILVVRNADLIVAGSLRWEGLIIVSGTDVGLKVTGSSSKEILGGLIINETGTPTGKAILDIQGNVRLLFSRQGLAQTAPLISPAILNNTYAHLPATVRQDYWRAVTP
jgi:hypothetical protein